MTEDEPTMALLAGAATRHDAAGQVVANIGFGSGLTSHALLASPPRSVWTRSRSSARWSRPPAFMPRNARAYEDPRSHIHIEDAKTFFAASGTRYDVIVSEPSNPWVSGVSTLFSEEFYGQVKRHLKPEGVLVQWIHAYELDLPLLASIFNALGSHFADYAVYSWSPGDLYVRRLAGRVAARSSRARSSATRTWRPISPPWGISSGRRPGGAAHRRPPRARGRSSPRPRNEPQLGSTSLSSDQRAPRTRFPRDNVFELAEMRDTWEPLLALLDGESRLPSAGPRGARQDNASTGRARARCRRRVPGGVRCASVDASRLTSQQRANASPRVALLKGCEGAQLAVVEGLRRLIHSATPYLDARRSRPRFERARNSPCGRSLTGRWPPIAWTSLKRWRKRDAPAIATRGARLLELDAAATDRERSGYIVSALGALLMKGANPRRAISPASTPRAHCERDSQAPGPARLFASRPCSRRR
jgi:hypothetical protein